MTEIYQTRGKEIRGYKIKKDGLDSEIKSNGNHQSFKIRFEEIDFNEIVSTKKPQPIEVGLFISVFFNLILLLVIFSDWLIKTSGNETIISIVAFGLLGGLSVWMINLFKRSKEKILKGSQNIFFFYEPKEQSTVDSFIENLKIKQRDYMREKYMQIDTLRPKERQEQTFFWLHDREFISKQELEMLIEDLNNRMIIDGKY
ncbi:MAG: hypothetical protein Q8S18_12145 [Bacteroidales bacterium]|nr:hypothetical protein [Bacteroidales bacterium]